MSSLSVPYSGKSFSDQFFNMDENDRYTCSIYNLKVVLLSILTIIILCCIFSSITSIFGEPKEKSIYEQLKEKFTGSLNNINTFKNGIKSTYANYSVIHLTSVDDSILSGQASRITTVENNVPVLYIEVYANLYIINGNPFSLDTVDGVINENNKNVNASYKVYLINTKSGDRKHVGNLYKDGDGVNKLKLKIKDLAVIESYMKFDKMEINYFDNGKESGVLEGFFSIN